MIKEQLVNKIAEQTGATKKATEAFINAFIKVVKEEVNGGEKISLTNFGTFEKVTVPEREGYNPADRKHITIPEKQKARFKVSKAFLD